MSSIEQRQAATEAFLVAANAVNTGFERADTVRATLDAITAAATRADPVQGALDVLEHAVRLRAALDELHTAAAIAVEHRSRSDLARDLDTRVGLLFPRHRPATTIDVALVASVSARGVHESHDEHTIRRRCGDDDMTAEAR